MPEIGLGVIAILFVAACLPLLSKQMTESLAQLVQNFPGAGGWLADKVRAMGQALADFFGAAFSTVTHAVGSAFHRVAQFLGQTWATINKTANVLAHVANIVGDSLYRVSGLQALVHELRALVHTVLHRFVVIGREIYHLRQRVEALEDQAARGIGNDVLPRIKTLESEIGNIESDVIPYVLDTELALANDITALGDYIRANFLSSATDAVTAAVAVALASLGLGGLRCSNFKNLLGRFGCGLGSLLNDLIGLALSVLALESVCAFLPLLEEAFGAVVGPMVHLLNEVPLGACEVPPKSFATLSVAAGPQPPPQTLGSLPTG